MDGERPDDRLDLEELARMGAPVRGRAASRVLRPALFALFAAVLVGGPVVLLTRGGRGSGPAPAPTAADTAGATATPSPSPSFTPSGAYVTKAEPCARVRVEPGLGKEVLDCIGPGNRLTSDGRTASADGFTWIHVLDPFKKAWGWAAAQFLDPA